MPDGYTTIIDAPLELAAQQSASPRSRIQVAALGRYKDPRYGDFSITSQQVDNWKRLLSEHFNGRVPIDQDHRTDKGTSSEAAGWIVNLEQSGDKVYADVEWTPLGESAISERRYLYISPTFVADLKDKAGRSLGPALLRAAQTNSPFLHDMPAVSLSSHATLAERVGDVVLKSDPSDSRPAMEDLTKKILGKLGIKADQDEEKILAAVDGVKGKDDKPPKDKVPPQFVKNADTVTLEQQASAEGFQLMKAEDAATLRQDAAAGKLALSTMRERRFDTAFKAALDAGRVDAKEETRADWREFYDASPDTAIRRLDALPVTINLTARGSGGDTTVAPDGYDAEEFQLNQRVETHMAEHKVDYPTALDAVLVQDERLVA